MAVFLQLLRVLSGVRVRRSALWIAGLCVVAIVGAMAAMRSHAGRAVALADAMPLPRVMLWAWERPDDLTSIRAGEAGVAYLAGTVFLREGAHQSGERTFVFVPRLQPLKLAPGVAKMPVVRIETSRGPLTSEAAIERTDTSDKSFTETQRDSVAATLAELARDSQPPMIQIDFDAAASEHSFYESLLADLRKRLGAQARISITALASWCEGDAWLARLPTGTIDEAVPMLFRMGPDTSHVAARLANGGDFRVGMCRSSAGISNDEPFSRAILEGQFATTPSWPQKRIYVFHKGDWDSASTTAVLGELEKWHADYSASR